ncbi:MAG: hypothetical protein EAZ08_13170 [Cytophagales bacterium]|nr:MAG: hypothetical protein EAZ08_13170 [Cytophagales bacterium]
MSDEIIVFYIHVSIAVLMLSMVFLHRFVYSETINNREGFRSALSMKNQEMWIAAHKYYGNFVLKSCFIWCIVQFCWYFLLIKQPVLSVFFVPYGYAIFFLMAGGHTDTYSEKTFDKDCIRK